MSEIVLHGDVWVATVPILDIDPDYPVRVEIEGEPIALCRVGDEAFALNDICSHAYAHLSDGFVEEGQLYCPLHQGSFCVRTGKAIAAPCYDPVEAYKVLVKDRMVYVSKSSVVEQKGRRLKD